MTAKRSWLSAAMVLAAAPAFAQPAPPPVAEPTRSIALELNMLDQEDAACRVTFQVTNGMGVRIDELGVEVVLFDRQSHVVSFLALSTGALPIGKRRVRQFDLPDLVCRDISEILVNDVSTCTGEGLTNDACLAALAVTTRAGINLTI